MPTYLIGFPLLLVPFAIYNIVVLLFRIGLTDALFSVHMISGADWSVSFSDILLTIGLLLLFVEILKSTRTGNKAIMDHILSFVLFIVMLGEFMIVRVAATSTFFILMLMSLIDVIAGFSVTIRTAQRDIGIEAAETLRSSSSS
jgi:hypothetical protein